MPNRNKEPKHGRVVPIEWHIPESVVTRYANNMIVQHTKDEFVISFFEVLPPLVFGSPEAMKEQLDKIECVKAEGVARIVVAPSMLQRMVIALQDNLKTYPGNMQAWQAGETEKAE